MTSETVTTGSCHCGAVTWRLEGAPESATACNCSTCRRYGALWAYDWEPGKVSFSGETKTYEWGRKWLAFHFCANCGCMVYWRANEAEPDGRRPVGFNVRLASPASVGKIPIVLHDTETKDDLPRDGRCVADFWF